MYTYIIIYLYIWHYVSGSVIKTIHEVFNWRFFKFIVLMVFFRCYFSLICHWCIKRIKKRWPNVNYWKITGLLTTCSHLKILDFQTLCRTISIWSAPSAKTVLLVTTTLHRKSVMSHWNELSMWNEYHQFSPETLFWTGSSNNNKNNFNYKQKKKIESIQYSTVAK